MKRIIVAALAALALVLAVAACGNNTSKGQRLENQQQNEDQTALEYAQPIPHYNYSQIRQNLIELETAQADGVQTTSFFFNLGVRDPIQTCPSIGAPIPTTDQLSNASKVVNDPFTGGSGSGAVVQQMDPNGVYSGGSSGTYVMCVGANGKPYADYWEGYVQTIFGPAEWNSSTHSAQLIGPPSFKFTK